MDLGSMFKLYGRPWGYAAALAVAAEILPVCTPAHAQEAAGVEEIVVTAQKREQNLQKVPISITALTANTLVANRIQDVRDLSSVVPNLTVRPSAGGNRIPNYSMRGIVTGASALGTDKGIALYIDGVYLQNTVGSAFDLGDIERIEVLKGPQGTLFGRNATGGAVSVVTRNPTGEFGVRQDLTYGNYDQFRSKTHVDLPQFGPLSLSATYLHSERRGDIRNLGAGTVWNYGPATGGKLGLRTSPKYLGSDNSEGIQAAAKLDIHPDLDLVYKFDYSRSDFTPEATGITYFPAGFLTTLYQAQDPSVRTPISRTRPHAVNNAFTTPGTLRGMGHNLTARFAFNDEISIKNILAFRSNKTLTTQQLDGLGGLRNLPVPVGGGATALPACFPGGNPGPTAGCLASAGQPFAFIDVNTSNTERQWSDEVQLNVQTDWFTVTAGYLHFHNKQRTGGIDNLITQSLLTAFYGQNTPAAGTAFVLPGNPGFIRSSVRVDSDAFYVQPEIHLTDQIDLIGGARITKDRKVGSEVYPLQPRVPFANPLDYNKTQANYLISLNYRPTEQILTYIKYATGYISGGQLATIPFAPETAKSFEGGIKADLFDRRVRSNLAVFQAKYGSIQVNSSGTLTGVPAATPFLIAIIPFGDAKAYGFEWENTIIPLERLTLTANVGYLHFKFDQSTIFPGFVFQAGAPGPQRFARPKFSGNASAQYETGEIVAGGHLLFRVDGNFESKNLLTYDVSPGTGPAAQENADLRRSSTAPAHWIVNARVALTGFEVGGSKAELALWGRNIFNNDQIVQSVNFGAVNSGLFQRARTYGVDLSLEF